MLIYKILSEPVWWQFRHDGVFLGSPVDLRDGYIHLSYADQLKETARRHFSGQRGLVLVAVDAEKLGDALRAEPSRGGALFPHLYAALPVEAVVWHRAIQNDDAGEPVLPALD